MTKEEWGSVEKTEEREVGRRKGRAKKIRQVKKRILALSF